MPIVKTFVILIPVIILIIILWYNKTTMRDLSCERLVTQQQSTLKTSTLSGTKECYDSSRPSEYSYLIPVYGFVQSIEFSSGSKSQWLSFCLHCYIIEILVIENKSHFPDHHECSKTNWWHKKTITFYTLIKFNVLIPFYL